MAEAGITDSIFGSSAPQFVFGLGASSMNFTAATTDVLTTATAHGLILNQRIKLSSTTTLPAPLLANTDYYVRDVTELTFKLSLTKNGAAIDITSTGTGTHSFNIEQTILVDYAIIGEPEYEVEEVIHKSELEADRDVLDRGEFINLQIKVLLFKYSTDALRRSKYEEIKQYHKKKVYLWKHRDGSAYMDSTGNAVQFYLRVEEKNLTTLDYRDVLILDFRALKGIDLTDGTSIVVQPSEIIMSGIGVI